MDELEAATKIIDAVVWPVVVIGVVWKFHEPIKQLIGRIKSVKAGGAEAEMYEQKIEAAVTAVVAETEKLQVDRPVAAAGERKEKTEALNVAVVELASLVKAKKELARGLDWKGLTPGRELMLRMVVETVGPEKALAMTPDQLQARWPDLSRNAQLNGGAMTGLHSVGIVDSQNRLTNIGAGLIHALAREIIALRKI